MEELIKVDAMGDQCPIPVVKTKKALDGLTGPGVVQTHVDNEIAVQNLTKLARQQQMECRAEKVAEGHFVVTIRTEQGLKAESGNQAETKEGKAGEVKSVEEETICQPGRIKKDTVVAVSSACMGQGNEELGKVLMKGFLYGLSQLEELPGTILFYNGGAALTTEGSDSLEDLKLMEAQGVTIKTCGTCLNYYHLTDALAVGEVTNMYDIVETLAGASRIIKP